MLTDAEARDLLHAAAATIEVDPAAPLPVVHRPSIWPMLVAAVAVIAIVVTTFALAERGSTPGPSNPSPSPAFDANQMPPVMGLDLEDALDLMSDRKLHVELVNEQSCFSERLVAASSPGVGASVEPQDTVTLTVLNPTQGVCLAPNSGSAWSLLRFALNVAPAPGFAETVTLYPGGGAPVVLTAAEASDPTNWTVCDGDLCGSALSVLAKAATQPSETGAGPILGVWEQPRAFNGVDTCMGGARVDSEQGVYFGITIAPPADGIAACPQVTAFYSSKTGLLEAVAIPLFQEEESSPEPTAEAAAVADTFVAWARGEGPPPAFADTSRYLLNDGFIRTVPSEQATQHGSWQFCYSGVPLGCPSPLETLEDHQGEIVQSTTPATFCVQRRGLGKAAAKELAGDTMVRLDQPEAEDCFDAFAIELWINDDGEITTVNHHPALIATN